MARTFRECGCNRFNPVTVGFSQMLGWWFVVGGPLPVSFLTVEAAAALLLDRQAFRLSSITIVDRCSRDDVWILDFVELIDKVLYEG